MQIEPYRPEPEGPDEAGAARRRRDQRLTVRGFALPHPAPPVTGAPPPAPPTSAFQPRPTPRRTPRGASDTAPRPQRPGDGPPVRPPGPAVTESPGPRPARSPALSGPPPRAPGSVDVSIPDAAARPRSAARPTTSTRTHDAAQEHERASEPVSGCVTEPLMITGLSALAAVTGGLRPEPPEPTGFSWGRVVEAITTFVERPAGAAPALELTVDLGAGAPGRLAVTAVGPGRITLQWIGWRGAATWLHARLPALVAALARRRIRVHEISHDDDR